MLGNGADILLLIVFKEIKLSVFISLDGYTSMSHFCLRSLFEFKIILGDFRVPISDFYLLLRSRVLVSKLSIQMKSDHIRGEEKHFSSFLPWHSLIRKLRRFSGPEMTSPLLRQEGRGLKTMSQNYSKQLVGAKKSSHPCSCPVIWSPPNLHHWGPLWKQQFVTHLLISEVWVLSNRD